MKKEKILPVILACFIGLAMGSIAFLVYGMINMIWNYSEYWTKFTLTSLVVLLVSAFITWIVGNIIENL